DSSCALHGEDLGRVFDAAVAVVPVVRPVVAALLSGGRDPQMGWPAIARMLARVRDGDPAALAALTGGVASGSPADDPWLRAGKDGMYRGVFCGDYGPQDDHAALLATGEAIALKAPRFAWRFWDATPIAHLTVGIGICVGWPLEARNPPHR